MYQVEIAEFKTPNTLALLPSVAKRFRPTGRFMVWVEGDTLVRSLGQGRPPRCDHLGTMTTIAAHG